MILDNGVIRNGFFAFWCRSHPRFNGKYLLYLKKNSLIVINVSRYLNSECGITILLLKFFLINAMMLIK